jgi:hypothetical protein
MCEGKMLIWLCTATLINSLLYNYHLRDGGKEFYKLGNVVKNEYGHMYVTLLSENICSLFFYICSLVLHMEVIYG